jgi:diguanylate cyclase (GGDEF)-like protein
MPARRLSYVAVAIAVPMLVVGLWLGNRWGGALATRTVDDLGLLVFAVAATVCSLRAAQKGRGRQRHSWLALGLGLGAWTVGEVIWCYYELWQGRDQTPFPSPADGAFLLFPVGAAAALFLFPVAHRGRSRTRLILDGIIVAGSLFVISWVTLLDSVYRAGGDNHFAFDVSLAYPIADLVTVTMTIVVLARARTAQRLTLGLLAAGVALMAFSDSAFVYLTVHNSYHSGSLIDLGWLAAFSILGLAALSSTTQQADEMVSLGVSTSAQLWLPYLPLLLAGIVGVHRVLPSLDSGPVPLAAVILMVTMLVRQFLVLADNRRLLLTVERQAFRDPLTGLANRALFTDRLNHAVRRQNRDLKPLAVLSLDLDGFKHVNDTLGHPAGDELLVRVAERLIGCLRSTDTVARFGGDEFAVLIEQGADDALLTAARVLETFQTPFMIGGRPLTMHASVGLTTATAEDTDVAAEGLLKQADLALYAAKNAGGNDLHIHPQRSVAVRERNRGAAMR